MSKSPSSPSAASQPSPKPAANTGAAATPAKSAATAQPAAASAAPTNPGAKGPAAAPASLPASGPVKTSAASTAPTSTPAAAHATPAKSAASSKPAATAGPVAAPAKSLATEASSASVQPTQPAAASPQAAAGPAAPARSVISTRELVKSYGYRTVVAGVNIQVTAGEIVGLLGPNGAGKTTTFYMIVGLVPATRGSVLLDGKPITRLRMHQRARAGLGYLPQEPSIFRTLTVEENVRAIVETVGIPRRLHSARTKEHLDELGLYHLLKQRAYTLSGGERRRLEIARALVTRPKFLLMDEPFSGVDPISVADVQKIILSLKKRGIGILITDHNVRETLRIVDRAYLIHQGRVLTEGSGEYLINDSKAREFYLGENFNL